MAPPKNGVAGVVEIGQLQGLGMKEYVKSVESSIPLHSKNNASVDNFVEVWADD